ncbi:CELLULOSE SYNTHASE A CATALYTIC SUBUNIT 7 [UDP-FORMING]-LIKE [Salix purpurea]|uniref:CELLULOSE SYNTHASE A CATALYTIC SUBUNIT 7 [UDP-FORMING]-LIKE n=1 Tax=Salix purpurea TaxID=77065 RepID=A0A9Q0TX71_SALPP|nr:CELLULOSE SYNTHASE A CATALYTIC SUBUNIT 7 [UDP-FORMING]-LIKE [Salix purpurea]
MKSLPLHACTPSISSAIINRSYSMLHFTALVALFYYRLSSILLSKPKPSLPYLLVFASEMLLSIIWLFDQAFTWRPVSRTTFPERLPEDEELPGIDVFICTADHKKEPPLEVMNTVLSAMALDYPSDKLSVYLSDDGGSSVTLLGMREAWLFARSWLPFCRRFGLKTRCPGVYFSSLEDNSDGPLHSLEYEEEKEKIKGKYELFKERVNKAGENIGSEEATSSKDHSPVIEVMDDEPKDDAGIKQAKMPLLVYVSREKRPSHSHHFKAGALNVLLRVSGITTNSPYILVLDCDMYCNDPTSARQAMCFHLDPKISPSLAFIQFPQKFRNINKNDIYDGQLRKVFVIRWQGMDGIQGPMLSGTGFYMKREALYGNLSQKDVLHLKQSFGHSNEFIMSVHKIYQYGAIKNTESSGKLQQEAQFLASCTYEKNTLWGEQMGFLYHSVVEDYFTGFILHCKGKTSVFCNPSKPAFLGSSTTNLNDLLVQGTRWNFGLFEVTLSKFCPFIYGLSRMPLLQTMCYGYLALQPLYFLPLWCLATLPQLCLLNGIPIYPQVSSSWFMVFSFIFLASLLKHLEEVLSTGASIQTLLNEQRIWMMKSVTAYTYGSLDAILKCFGMREASFLPTNKVADDEQVALYQMGKLNFQSSTMILTPIITLIILNMVSFIGGVARMFIARSWDDTFGQVFLSLYILMVNYPVIEGMLLRKDKGRVPTPVTLLSLIITIFLLSLGHMTLNW